MLPKSTTTLALLPLLLGFAEGGCTTGRINGDCASTNSAFGDCGVEAAEIDRACAASATHFSTIAEGDEYQFDKTFMDGGGEFHEPNIPFAQKDTEALEDFVSEYATTNTRIAWPYYEALEPYAEDRALADGPLMSNFRNCDMKAVMCCTTGSLDGAPFTPNAQVCASDLAPGRQSNHMYYGQAFFTDTAPLAHCVGFSWRDGTDSDRFKGNTLYDISYKHFLETKQIGAIPGAPLCGCVDQMPTVTTAACRKVSASGEKLLVTKNADGTLTITQDVGVSVSVEPCTKNGVEVDMVDGYSNGGSKNDLKAKIVQSADCSTARADHLNDQFYVPATENPFETKKPTGVEWAKVAGQGFDFVPGSGLVFNDQDDETEFQQQLKQNLIDGFLDKLDESSSKIIYRHCGTCLPGYQHLFYKRINKNEARDTVSLELFLNNWTEENNVLDEDFVLYNNYEDACASADNPDTKFTVCTYGEANSNLGFPGECGIGARQQCQWNNYNGERDPCGGYYRPTTTSFYIDVTPGKVCA